MNDLREKRDWYEKYSSKIKLGLIGRFKTISRFSCPCCGYPTLAERNSYEICSLCSWEDDGQDDDDSSQISGGPNHGYSLDQARENFEKYSIMYSPDNDPTITGGDSEKRLSLKKELISIFKKMRLQGDDRIPKLWKKARVIEKLLDAELMDSIREYEKGNKP